MYNKEKLLANGDKWEPELAGKKGNVFRPADSVLNNRPAAVARADAPYR